MTFISSLFLYLNDIQLETKFSTIMFFKHLCSRDFQDLFNQYIFSSHKRYEYCKTGARNICVNLPRFLVPHSVDDFDEFTMPMGHSLTLRMSWPTCGRRGILAQQNSDSFNR